MIATKKAEADTSKSTTWQPRIVAFVCNWCTYSGMDLAGTSRMKYAPGVQVIRVPCAGRMNAKFILRAFEQGADAVWVSGCHPGDCHYSEGNYHARRRFAVFKDLLELFGVDPARMKFTWISAAEGRKWADAVTEYVEKIRALGPYRDYPGVDSLPRRSS